jgi:hypothetical protein
MATPSLAKIDSPRVAPMGFANCPTKSVLGSRDGQQMNVVRRETLGPNPDPFFAAPVGHQIEINGIVVRVEKRLLPAVTALGNVVRHSRHNDAS